MISSYGITVHCSQLAYEPDRLSPKQKPSCGAAESREDDRRTVLRVQHHKDRGRMPVGRGEVEREPLQHQCEG